MIDAVLVPSSLTQGVDDPKIATYKVGQVARAASIHRIGEVVVYPDPAVEDAAQVVTLLRYAEAPPYLRKTLFPRRPELSHAGVLPPLNTPHHKAGGRPRIGDVRVGYATEHGVEIGADRPAKPSQDLDTGRVTVEIVAREGDRFVVAPRRGPPPAYWGYEVTRTDSLADAVEAYNVAIGTADGGEPEPRVEGDGSVAVAFGSPEKSLARLLVDEGLDRSAMDAWYDAVPDQGTDSIRTEEAVLMSLEPLRKLLVGQPP